METPAEADTRTALESLLSRLGLGPVPAGLLLAGMLLAAFVGSELLLGRHRLLEGLDDPVSATREARIAVLQILIAVYLPTIYLVGIAASRTAFARLAPAMDLSPKERAARASEIGHYPGLGAWLAVVIGLSFLVGVTYLTTPPSYWNVLWSWDEIAPEVRWHRVLAPVIGFWLGRQAYTSLAEARQLAGWVAQVPSVDVLDAGVFAPVSRWILTQLLLVVGLASIVSLFVFDQGFGVLVAITWPATLALTGLVARRPLMAVVHAVRAAKVRELGWVHGALREARRELEAGTPGSRSLVDLVAWESRVSSVRELPFDTSAVVRLTLYLLIPLGSWLGGAMVERLIDSVLD